MRKNILKISFIICIAIFVLCLSNTISNAAASFDASISKTSVKVGDTVTLTIKANNAAGNYSVSTSNANITLTNGNAEEFLDNSSTTLTYKAVTAGTVNIVAKATDMTDLDNSSVPVTGSKTFTITISEPSSENSTSGNNGGTTGETTTPTTPQTPTTPTVTEPKFTDVNKTMYATGNINLRASWSTSSAATTIQKGTELKVTGTSTEKVNGYVWYRVSYNGATKYVASSLLTNTKPEEEKKSDNAYLKSLTIEGQELTPVFNKETTSYTMQIESDITELNIKAEAEDEKASVSIQGNKDLKEGENKVTVSVSAEDGTIKIYEITVTKNEKTALGLQSLAIKDTDIASMFKTDTYEYEIYVKDVAKLEIEAIANDETATVEILGNEDLQEGENTITIIVSSQDGKEKVTYQIKANKIIANVDTVTNTKKEIDPKIYLYIGIGAVLLIALVIVIIYTIKHRNEDEYEYTDNFEGFPEELPERQEKEEYEENEQNIEQTQEINYNNEENETNVEEQKTEERKAKIDYFLDDAEDDEKPRRRRGKHF